MVLDYFQRLRRKIRSFQARRRASRKTMQYRFPLCLRPRVEALEDRVVPSGLVDNVNGFHNPANAGNWSRTRRKNRSILPLAAASRTGV